MPARRDTIHLGLLGGGMFGGDVVLRAIEDLERCGLTPYLGRVGLDHLAPDTAGLHFRLASIATRTEESARRLAAGYRARLPGSAPRPFWGEKPWEELFAADPSPDLLFIATPDHLHTAPALHALERGAHLLVEKPLALKVAETDAILELSRDKGLVVGVDMHKRYDPCHRLIFEELAARIGAPLYGRAVLEEPLLLPTRTFKWAERSNPFSYVGVHWVDLFQHYLGLHPSSVHAVGQKELLVRWDRQPDAPPGARPIDTFDAMQVSVDTLEGVRLYYVNSWINPPEFEGPVNQEMELVGTRGKIEFDQQYRGLRATLTGVGSRTFNPHFTADVRRLPPYAPGAQVERDPGAGAARGGPGGRAERGPLGPAYDGYGKDSIVVIVERAARVILGLSEAQELAGTYPDAVSARRTVAVIESADLVAKRNLEHLRSGRGSPATARISEEGIDLIDPLAGEPQRIYRGGLGAS